MTWVFQVNRGDITHERLDGEVVAINMRTGRYYSLSGPAADIWWLVDQSVPRSAWVGVLAEVYEAPEDWLGVSDFLEACSRAGLIIPADASSPAPQSLPLDFVRGAWTAPRLEEFEDLQDLILVDPIHDTTALGWPHVADE